MAPHGRLEFRVALAAALGALLPGVLAAAVTARTELHAAADVRARIALADGDWQRSRADAVDARRALAASLARDVARTGDPRTVLARALGTAGLTALQVVTRDGIVVESAGVHRGGACPLVAESDAGGGRRLVATYAQGCPIEVDGVGDRSASVRWPWVLAVACVASALAGALGWRVARPVSRALALLGEAVGRVGAGDFTVRVRPRGDEAVGDLLGAFNRMVEELSLSRERIDYLQRLAGWRDVARRLAHEIKNPLTPIQLAVQEVARRYPGDDPKYKRTLETAREVVEEEVAALRRMVSAFSDFARLPEVKTAPADLGEFVRDAGASRAFLDEAAGTDRRAEVTVTFEPGEGALPVAIDRVMLRRACDNLVRNAVQAIELRHTKDSPARGTVWVRAQRHPGTGDEGDQAWLVVEDDGPGIPADQRTRVFDPYFTTKAEGTGLGLAIVRKIALDHAGDVGLEARPGGGARFVITLPLLDGRRGRLSFVTFSGRSTDAPRTSTPG